MCLVHLLFGGATPTVPRSRALLVLLAALPLALLPARASAQAGMGTDIIVGVVTGEDGAPLQDATVEAYSLETQVTRRARTDVRGRFTILFADGGGQYRMTARVLGMTPHAQLLVRDADEDRLVWNVRLRAGAVQLDAISVQAGPQLRSGDSPTPGSSERAFGADQLARLPLDATDLASLAGLVPGVLTIASTDSTATAFSVAGLGADANAVTLDGLLFGTATVPQEGLRQTRVITSTYDVSRGSFSGGLVASTTRSGSNVLQGSTQAQVRDEALSVNAGDTPYTQGFNQSVLSGGLGGPLVRDRLFVFASGQARLRSDPQQTLLSAAAADFTRLGVSPDSVARFTTIVDGLGVPHASVPNGATRASDNYSGMLRLDWVMSNAHSLSLRGDWRGTSQDPARLGPLALPQTGGQMTSSGGGVMATLSSHFGAAVLNEFRGYLQTARNDGSAFSQLPQGRVQVASLLPDSALGVTTLVFGGSTGFPSRSRGSSFEGSDELSWLPGSGAHRLKLGASFLTERAHDFVGANLLGTYTYNSLADLETGRAASFRRTLGVAERQAADLRWAFYAGDVWMVTRPFQLTYGVRLEGSSFGDPPAYNPAVDAAFGRRTDRLPTEWHVSPRAGFSWTLGAVGGPGGAAGFGGMGGRGGPGGGMGGRGFSMASTVIRGGIGEFRNQPSTGLVAQARSATGLAQSASEIVCAGDGVPSPAWAQYWASADSIPDACLSGGALPPGGFQAARSVVVLAPGFEAPRAWRGSLSVERRLTQLLRLTVEGSVARGVAQTGYRDLNIVGAPRFALAAEGGRPVYVAPADITPGSGTPLFPASRRDSVFGHVYEARSDLRSRSFQATTGLSGIVGKGIVVSASYSWQRVRDQQTGARGNTTATDPNAVEWGRSDMERKHAFLLTLTYPVSQALELTSIGRLTSGAPFTPMVGGDVNGDGLRNDRAFVFAAGTATPEAQGMQRLLAEAAPSVRSCLLGQLGAVALRNSCDGPWQATLDFQANWRPALLGLNRRLQVSIVTYNFLRGLDELLHGSAGARGWGLTTRPDNTLLYVTGFDPVAQRYAYTVNERFGATGGSATAYRPPFQIGIQARLTIGPDRMRQALDALRGGGGIPGAMAAMGSGPGGGPGGAFGGGGFRGPVANPLQLIARIDSALPNPAAVVLGMRDSLQLDSGQVVLLTLLRDSLTRRNGVLMDSLRAIATAAGRNADASTLMNLMPRLRPLFDRMRSEVGADIVSVHAILREDQWEKVPESVKVFRLRGPGMGPGQGPRPEGERRPPG
jgi:hypothetical protein